MATSVSSGELEAVMRERGTTAYVVTVTDRATPHVVQAEIRWSGAELVAVVGAHTAEHARRQPHLSLLYPARHRDDYSLIVDAVATAVTGDESFHLTLSPTRAVLHRPGPPPDPTTSPCGSDCVPLSLPASR
jgi:hypothetical protein